jgi:hypothetical protein
MKFILVLGAFLIQAAVSAEGNLIKLSPTQNTQTTTTGSVQSVGLGGLSKAVSK